MNYLRFRHCLHCVAVAILLFFSFQSYSQVQTARYNAINGNCGGYYEYLPQGYSTNTGQSYPLIVAIHGIGELGNGTSDLGNILNCWVSLPRLIANGGFPSSFSSGGQNFSFIVVSPQFKAWPSGADVNAVIDYAIQNYRVDQSRIYVTGLSMGGGATWDFAGSYPSKAAAVVPICGAQWPDASKAQAMANAKLGVWATHNQDDGTVSVGNTTGWVTALQQYGADVQSTIFPVSGHDAWTKTYDPNFTQNGVNIYQWMLQHQRGNNTPVNQSPSANAGANQTITLPVNSATLSGSGSDPDGTISSYQWSQVSGPSQASIVSQNSASTVVNNLVQGNYVFTLKVTDDKGANATSNVSITVNAAAPTNQPPSVNAGPDQTITLPTNTVNLSGLASDADGSIAYYQWAQASGPSQSNIVSAFVASTVVNNLVEGTYVFVLKVEDDKGATATADIRINVNPAPVENKLPVVNAGSDQTITLPQNSVTLSGSGSDSDGSISSYTWSQLSGPSQANIVSQNSATTIVNNLLQGSYTFTLKVTDNKGATATSNVKIIVNAAPPPPNQSPSANAGANQTITLPVNSATLSGSGSDPDGTISSYQWSQVSGPSQASIVSQNSASTAVNNLVQGNYVFRLTVEDNNGANAWSEAIITVNEAPNKSPVANTGVDQAITLPVSFTMLSGSGSDSDGSISSLQWSQVSGPSQAHIINTSSAITRVDSLKQGVYVFRFTVTDNKGTSAWDEMSVTVNRAPNQSPVVNAGPDQTITLPVNSVSLSGSAFDTDGSIVSAQWTQISGPTKTNFSSASPIALRIQGLLQGVYTFRLTVTDNDGATKWDDIAVTVMPDPRRQSSAMLYPNPAKDIVNVKIEALTLQSNSTIRIINSAGKIVHMENFMRTNFIEIKQVDISKLPEGIYFLSINTDINTNKSLMLIKQ